MTSSSDVRLIFFEQSIGCETCAPARRALQQLAGSVEHVALEVFNLVLDKEKAAEYGVDRVPTLIVSGPAGDRIRYLGAPLGGELATVVEAVRMTAAGASSLSDQTRAKLQTLTKPVDIKVFFTPTCVYCPQMVSLANQIAIESPLVTAAAIDATEYPDLVEQYGVNGVPKTILNDEIEVLGAVPEGDFVDGLLRVAAEGVPPSPEA